MIKYAGLLLLVAVAAAALLTDPGAAFAVEEQVIAPGDILSISVLGEKDLTKQVVVDQYGKISLPLANEVEVGGVTTSEAAGRLRTALKDYLKNPQISVEITQMAKRQAVVTGAVTKPGVYDITPDATVLAAITLAGGYTADADLSKVVVTRGPRKENTITIDLREFLSGAKPEANIRLQPNDTIVVPQINPTAGNVFVMGEVVTRGPYPWRQGMTFRDAIAAAGGPGPLADTAKASIKHRDGTPGPPVDYAKASAGDPSADVPLQPGDTIFVPAFESSGMFTIIGMVNKPGQYPVKGTMFLTDAVAAAGGTMPQANMSRVNLTRTVAGKSKSSQHDLKKITGGGAQNVAVLAGDTILVNEKKDKDSWRLIPIIGPLLYLFR